MLNAYNSNISLQKKLHESTTIQKNRFDNFPLRYVLILKTSNIYKLSIIIQISLCWQKKSKKNNYTIDVWRYRLAQNNRKNLETDDIVQYIYDWESGKWLFCMVMEHAVSRAYTMMTVYTTHTTRSRRF